MTTTNEKSTKNSDSATLINNTHEAIQKLLDEISDLNKRFIQMFEKLQEKKTTILTEEAYICMLDKLLRSYNTLYTLLNAKIRNEIAEELIKLMQYEYILDEQRFTLKKLEEKYHISLPNIKFKQEKMKHCLYDPKHPHPLLKKKS